MWSWNCKLKLVQLGIYYSIKYALHFLTTVPSAPPQSLVGVANSPTQVMLSWSPPPPIDINGDLQYYDVRVTEAETSRQWTFFSVNTFITVGGLHPYFNYHSQVAAHTVIGSGPFTGPSNVQTQETGMCTTLLQWSVCVVAFS